VVVLWRGCGGGFCILRKAPKGSKSKSTHPPGGNYVLSQHDHTLTSPQRQGKGVTENARTLVTPEYVKVWEKAKASIKLERNPTQEKKPHLTGLKQPQRNPDESRYRKIN
jgi:hypothetical protein